MPLTRVDMRAGKGQAYRRAILDGIYEAMRDTFDVPEDDRFMIVTEHGPENFLYGTHYMDIERSDDLVVIQMTVSDTRTIAKKKALFRAIADRLVHDPGLRPQDIFLSLVEAGRENWSFGHGEAQYAAT